jgi:hypothetical protein
MAVCITRKGIERGEEEKVRRETKRLDLKREKCSLNAEI